jgi:Type IV secretion-system coupling protein DNA-binding domain
MIGELLSGWPGLGIGYACVQVPMAVALARRGGSLGQIASSPLLALPLTALVGAGMTLLQPLLTGVGLTANGLAQLALGATLSGLAGAKAGRMIAATSSVGKSYQRGAMVSDRLAEPSSHEASITLAGQPIRELDETKHFKLIGTTGTGKSTAINELLDRALARGDRAVIADPDGGYLRRFFDPHRGDAILNPFEERSVKWDLFAEIKAPYDVEQLAQSLIPDHEGGDRSWRAYARTFFTAVTQQAHEAGVRDVAELYRLLMIADTGELRTLVEGTPAQPFLEQHNQRMFDSIRSVTSSAVRSLDHVARQQGERFSVREWVSEERPGVLFMPYKAGQIPALHSTISAWMRLAIFEAMDRPIPRSANEQRPLWFVIDELDALGQIDGLKDALARLRKFGGRCVLGFQSLAQVSSTYGHGEAHTLVENCGNTLILRCSASEGGGTARFASQLIGEREVLRTTVSRSRRSGQLGSSFSRNESFSFEPAVMPSQIEQLPDLAGYLKRASDPQWQLVRLRAKAGWEHRQAAAPLAIDGVKIQNSRARASGGYER